MVISTKGDAETEIHIVDDYPYQEIHIFDI
jgi:hypothetical protein